MYLFGLLSDSEIRRVMKDTWGGKMPVDFFFLWRLWWHLGETKSRRVKRPVTDCHVIKVSLDRSVVPRVEPRVEFWDDSEEVWGSGVDAEMGEAKLGWGRTCPLKPTSYRVAVLCLYAVSPCEGQRGGAQRNPEWPSSWKGYCENWVYSNKNSRRHCTELVRGNKPEVRDTGTRSPLDGGCIGLQQGALPTEILWLLGSRNWPWKAGAAGAAWDLTGRPILVCLGAAVSVSCWGPR